MTRLFILISLLALMSGCVHSPIAYNKDQIVAENGGGAYQVAVETVALPYAKVKRNIEQTSVRCLSGRRVAPTANHNIETDNLVDFYSDGADTFTMAYRLKMPDWTEEQAIHILVARVQKESASSTQLTTYHYKSGDYKPVRDVLIEWARGEHDMCHA